MPEIRTHEEVKANEGIPVVQRVRHIHEVTRLRNTCNNRIRVAGLHLLIARISVSPILPPIEHGEFVDARQLSKRFFLKRRRATQVNIAGEVNLPWHKEAGCTAAIAGRRIPVARNTYQAVQRTRVLNSVATMLDSKHIPNAAVAITGFGAKTRRIRSRSLFNLLCRNMGNGRSSFQVKFSAASLEVFPHRFYLMNAAICQRHFKGTFQRRIDFGFETVIDGKAGLIRHPTLRYAGEEVLLLRFFATGETHFHRPGLAFPLHSLGVEIGKLVANGIPAHHFRWTTVRYQVRLFQKTSLRLKRAGLELRANRTRSGLHVFYHEERSVRPLLHELVIPKIFLNNDIHPCQRQCAVCLRIERLPNIRLFAQICQARVNRDELVSIHGHVDGLAARVVVVGKLRRTTPANHNLGLIHRCLPAEGIGGIHKRTEVTWTFAHLIRRYTIRASEQHREYTIGTHAPATAGTGHHHDRRAAELFDNLIVLFTHGCIGFIPGNTHPTGIIGIFRVRAFHRIQNTIRMICRLNGRL